MRTVHNEPFQKHPGDLLLDGFGIGLGEEVQQSTGEIMRVTVGIPQLIGYCVQEQVPVEICYIVMVKSLPKNLDVKSTSV